MTKIENLARILLEEQNPGISREAYYALIDALEEGTANPEARVSADNIRRIQENVIHYENEYYLPICVIRKRK